MNYRSRIAAAIAAAAITTTAGCAAANAAVINAPRNAAPGTVPVACASTAVWLRLQATAGEFCYTGNGAIAVDLAGVRAGQTIGRHRVCLYTLPGPVHCFTGPRTFGLTPPAYLRSVTITTP